MKQDQARQDLSRQRGGVSRRHFIKVTGASALWLSAVGSFNFASRGVSIIADPADPVAGAPPSIWAANELLQTLTSGGIAVSRCEKLSQAGSGDLCILVAGSESPLARQIFRDAKIDFPVAPEALGLIPAESDGRQVLLVCGYDARGLVYALLDLADRIVFSDHPFESLTIEKPVVERPANSIRSLCKLFVSEVEDKPWFYDREMWREYLTMAASQRFNRFNLGLGLGYDFLQDVTDAYFLFAYPFFIDVPGYNVRVPQLSEAERTKNLETLRFISDETVARGMQFQLGIWMHGYQWLNSPSPNYTIEGLSAENHGAYCHDAIRQLLQTCPNIGGVTIRTHGESGVQEGSYNFWRKIFEGVAACGRTVGIDLHAKGIDQTMIDGAIGAGVPVTVSPKYWAEHLGMTYHQADIRAFEIPKQDQNVPELMKLSAGTRSFMRYGYGDLLKEDRRYRVLERVWPGTQRLLLWGDPVTGAAHSKAFGFCGIDGVELMEPLSFKGRRGSGVAGGRCGYQDSSLTPRWDWEKFAYTLRVFGRMAYNPHTDPETWRRYLSRQFGDGAPEVESALSNASRILPIVLTAHGVSAANNLYWPELYTNFSICDPENENPYFDTPSPKIFGNVSPMDPQLFLRINDFVLELLNGDRSGKYTPVEYAQWVEDYADAAVGYLAKANGTVRDKSRPEFRRMAIDVDIQAGLGHFFGAKFRSGILYAIFEQTGDRSALELSLELYQKGRNYWVELANRAKDVYKSDLTVGEQPYQRGHWLDRLPALDADIALMAKKLSQTPPGTKPQPDIVRRAIEEATGRPHRPTAMCHHVEPGSFKPGEPMEIEIAVNAEVTSARLYYRHVNQAERWVSAEMQPTGKSHRATIPASYTNSPYPLQYYFELKQGRTKAWLHPGLAKDLTDQPYFVVRGIRKG
ncbi:MAG TPA: hypothetical protein VMG34_09250 [Bacteroidota bacterium]|nr:hypothetical protein [Bacteroidota bacterium]